jgi:hypothetical protein
VKLQRIVWLAALMLVLGWPTVARAQSPTATISMPAGVSFSVSNVTQSVTGSPGPFRITFSTKNVSGNANFYVSVKADAVNFAGPGTTRIPASKVSWTATPIGGGTGSPGTLSSAAYSQVYVQQQVGLHRHHVDTRIDCSRRPSSRHAHADGALSPRSVLRRRHARTRFGPTLFRDSSLYAVDCDARSWTMVCQCYVVPRSLSSRSRSRVLWRRRQLDSRPPPTIRSRPHVPPTSPPITKKR